MKEQFFPRATPSEEGIDPKAILEILDEIDSSNMNLHSLMILRHGKVIAEGWWHPYSAEKPHMLYSLTKSFTSIATGFAIQEGLFSLEDAVLGFFPDKLPSPPCPNWEKVKVKHLLTHSIGFSKDPIDANFSLWFYNSTDWVEDFLKTYVDFEPGSQFTYTDIGPDMISAILQTVTGETMECYLKKRLFDPLEITEWGWESYPPNVKMGGAGLLVKTEDLAKFGQFILQKGSWKGKQLLNSSWFDLAATPQVSTDSYQQPDWKQGYGYLFWKCQPDDFFRGDGAFGQFLLISPKEELVIAITAGNNVGQENLILLWEKLLPALSMKPISPDSAAEAALVKKLASLSLPYYTGAAKAPENWEQNGGTFVFSPSAEEITKLSFSFGEQNTIQFFQGEQSCTCKIGFNGFAEGEAFAPLIMEKKILPAACSGKWEGNILHLQLAYTNTPFIDSISVTFDAFGIILKVKRNLGFGPPQEYTAFGRPVLK